MYRVVWLYPNRTSPPNKNVGDFNALFARFCVYIWFGCSLDCNWRKLISTRNTSFAWRSMETTILHAEFAVCSTYKVLIFFWSLLRWDKPQYAVRIMRLLSFSRIIWKALLKVNLTYYWIWPLIWYSNEYFIFGSLNAKGGW